MSDNRGIGYAIFGFCFGIWSFFWGFKRLRRKRLVENIPTSTVRGMAMGLVELSGKAKGTAILKAPLTKTECVLFRYLIEEYRSSGKSGRWVTIASGNSFYCPFGLDDRTGKIMVYPQSAELILPLRYKFKTGIGKVIPANLREFMEGNWISYQSWLGSRPLRFKEWFILDGENIYVLGSAKKTDAPNTDYRNVVMRRIEELKNNPQKMKEVDINKDGEISIQEWDLAMVKLEQELLEDTLKSVSLENSADVIIGKGDTEKIFIISNRSEKELIKKLFWESLLGIYGGAALSLASLGYLLVRLKAFRF
ncbi:MAG: hypothetical protein QMD94_04555 [Candidatus Omnitrophota bacterium]|nr:hypothetical protein [Candidatus Omnitrophota bacterium]